MDSASLDESTKVCLLHKALAPQLNTLLQLGSVKHPQRLSLKQTATPLKAIFGKRTSIFVTNLSDRPRRIQVIVQLNSIGNKRFWFKAMANNQSKSPHLCLLSFTSSINKITVYIIFVCLRSKLIKKWQYEDASAHSIHWT